MTTDDDRTLSRMRWARDIVAKQLGVDELPPDAEVECGLGPDGALHVRGTVVAKAVVPMINVTVRLEVLP